MSFFYFSRHLMLPSRLRGLLSHSAIFVKLFVKFCGGSSRPKKETTWQFRLAPTPVGFNLAVEHVA
jgi:hypothetical protein